MARVLAIDVGVGTQDILVFDDARTPENNVKLVLPAMTQVLAKRLRSIKGDVYIRGETMGGGPLTMAVAEHIAAGYSVRMTPQAAMSIRDDLEEVRGMGVKIVETAPRVKRGNIIESMDFDFEGLFQLLARIGEDSKFDSVGIAVQDHGHAKGKPDRIFRFEKFAGALRKGVELQDFLHVKPPSYYTRMNAMLRTAKKFYKERVFVMDTKIAAIAGALHGVDERPVIAMDIGNGHTMAALVGDGYELLGLMEHHTWMLNRLKLEGLVRRFADGELTNKEVFDDGGHGCHVEKATGFKEVRRILVTGPNRALLYGSGLEVEFPTPMGDVMMTGPQGIVDLIKARG